MTDRDDVSDRHSADTGAPAPGPARVRPYVITGGRTPSSEDLPPEAVVKSSASTPPRRLSAEEDVARRLCLEPKSVAELASALSLPLGVVTVIVSDLVAAGVLEAQGLARAGDTALLEKLIRGVEAL